MKIKFLVLFIISSAFAYSVEPSAFPKFSDKLPTDIIAIETLVGDTINFYLDKQSSYSNRVINYISNYFYNIKPDTIVVHNSKKEMIENVDFFVLKNYETILRYREKDEPIYNLKNFKKETYNPKKYKKYIFVVDNLLNLEHRRFIVNEIQKTTDSVVYILTDLLNHKTVKFCPPKNIQYEIESQRLDNICRNAFPKTIYVSSALSKEYVPLDRLDVEDRISIFCSKGWLDVDATYGSSYSKRKISTMPQILTSSEYINWDKKYTIDYSVNPYHIVDTSLVESIAGEGRTGILIKFKGTCFSQNIHRDDLTNKVYNSDESLFWFAGIDTINNKIYYRVCENDKVFWIRERDAEFNEIESCTSIKKNWSNLTDKQKEYYFDYTKYFVCHKLHQEHINEWFELMNKYKSIGILLENCKIYGDEYSTGFEVKVTNMSNKTIKYIIFNIVGLNSVKDKVKYKGTYIQETRGIGPISPLETAYYDFEHLWWTDIVEYFDIQSINIEYTDGTKKQITDWKSARKSWLIELQEKKLNYAPELKTNVKW